MPIHRDDPEKLISEILDSVDATVSGISEYMSVTSSCNDWSFVIVSQAFLETRISLALVRRMGEDALRSHFERIPLADEEIGKLDLTENLSLLTKDQRAFVRRMAELRNKLAHDFRYVRFTFEDHLRKMDENQRKSWTKCITWPWPSDAERQLIANSWKTQAVILFAVTTLVQSMEVNVSETCSRRSLDEAELKHCKEVDRILFETTEQ